MLMSVVQIHLSPPLTRTKPATVKSCGFFRFTPFLAQPLGKPMHRCSSFGLSRRPLLRWLRGLCVILGLLMAVPTSAQTETGSGTVRNFPDAALRGTLIITASGQAKINGAAVQLAPGMRLFSPQNTLVMLHTVLGRPFIVHYLIEYSTGMLITAWILSSDEAAQPYNRATTAPAQN